MAMSIELDCPPGWPRPGDLIESVLKDTGLTAQENWQDERKVDGVLVSTFFGNWQWDFAGVSEADWVEKIRPIIQPRIEALYNNGVVRYASW